ncbi:MAG: hypothetical protein EBV70_04755, partial [Actinobacteria bacterium]|nr:hypothetical protein [Actinomycetota bacterium]
IAITGALDLNAAITNASSLTVSGVSDLGANVTTSGIQTYTGAVTLSGGNRTLTTTDSQITFGGTVNSEAGQTRALTLSVGSSEVEFNGVVGGSVGLGAIAITGALDLNAAITNASSLSVSTTSDLGADVTTSGTQTYTGAVVLSINPVLTTTSNTITFSSTVNAVDATDRDLTFATGTGTATFTGAVGTTNNLGTITNASGQQLTFSDAVTATTIANNGILLFNATSNKTVSSNITKTGTTTIQVINSANGAPGIITLSGNITAGTITIGTTEKSGSALFNGTVTGVNIINVVGGDASGENSLGNFANTVWVTGISLDNNTGTASVIFSGTDKTIVGTINGAGAGEGIITVSGANNTFYSTIGNSNRPAQLIINGATTFNADVQTASITTTAAISNGTILDVSGASSIGADITTSGTQTYTGAVTLTGAATLTTTDSNISFGSSIGNSSAQNLTFNTGTGTVSVTGAVGSGTALGTITLTQNGALTATTLNTAAEGYNVAINAGGTITNAVTFSNSGTVTLGDASGDSITFTAGVTATAPSQVNIAGTVQSTNTAISIGDSGTPIVLTGNSTISAGSGAITLGGTVNGAST